MTMFAPTKKKSEDDTPLVPDVLSALTVPPFRTWAVTTWDTDGEQKAVVRLYEAHDIEINPNGLVVFHVFFVHPIANKILQAPRYFLHHSEWRAIEEINPFFSEPVKH